MGAGISENYENITLKCVIGFWNVHSATNKQTGNPCTLWVLDNDKIKAIKCKKSEREAFLNKTLEQIKQMRLLKHPHILNIYEVNENTSAISFSAEPFEYSLLTEISFSNDEVLYIALQLAETLNFIHTSAKMGHLSISQSSIVLTSSLDLKICDFTWASPIINESNTVGSCVGQWVGSPFQPELNFSSPELLNNRQITPSADIFSFACVIASAYCKRQIFACSTPSEIPQYATNASSQLPLTVPKEMKELLKKCFALNPADRPQSDELIRSPAFNSLQARILKYMDLILTKDPADKFTFFKNLPSALEGFSPRIRRKKFVPLMITETKNEPKFGPILIPLCVKIGQFFEESGSFTNEIMRPLMREMTMTKPPEILLNVFSVINLIIEHVEPGTHYDIVYPIYTAALQSENLRLQTEAINNMPLIIGAMSREEAQRALLPKLLEFMGQAQDPCTMGSVIDCLAQAVPKVDPDWFCAEVLGRLFEIWRTRPADSLAPHIVGLLEKARVPLAATLTRVVPLCAMILARDTVDSQTQSRLCALISGAVDRTRKDRRLESKWVERAREKTAPAEDEDEKPAPPKRPEVRQPTSVMEAMRMQTRRPAQAPGVPQQPPEERQPPRASPPRQIERVDTQKVPDASGESFWADGSDEADADEEAPPPQKQRPVVLPRKEGEAFGAPAKKSPSNSMFEGLSVSTSAPKRSNGWKKRGGKS